MTQVERPRLNVRRLGVVYGIDVLDHEAWMRGELVVMRNDYIGQTTQRGRGRENQHRDDKPWSDLIVGSPRILWESVCLPDKLDEVERSFIKQGVDGVRPRLNWKLNEDNAEQVPIPRQVEQRWARDDREGRPRWVPLDQRPVVSLLDKPTRTFPDDRQAAATVSVSLVRRVAGNIRAWPAWQQKTALWATSWLLLAATAAGGMYAYGVAVRWASVLALATIAQVTTTVWSLHGAPITKGQRRAARRRRRARRSR